MSSQQNPHTQAEPRRFGRTRLGSVQGLVWFASLMVLLLLIVVAVFDMRIAGIMRPTTTDAASAPAPASPPAAAASDPDATASAAAPASAKASAPASASAPVSATAQAATAAQADTGRSASGASQTGFRPPAADDIADTPMGEVIRTGERIFLHTGVNAKAFVGNALNCVNCHLDAGRLADSAPMWGAYLLYPAYRNKTKHVDTFAERLRGCFTYSMNGKAPPFGDDVLVALEAYSYWMAKGAPVGERLPGAGFLKLDKPSQAPDRARGQTVFEAHCALCHGADGQGQRAGEVQVFPPLWGARSFNWGAGMANINNAAGFIKANMPLGLGGTLTDQQAWDVATFMNSHERPQDPRFTGNIADTRKRFHDSEFSLYGQTVNGQLLGQGVK